MTRCRCAECGNILAAELKWDQHRKPWDYYYEVHPCGACMQEAAADAIACYEADREPIPDESRD